MGTWDGDTEGRGGGEYVYPFYFILWVVDRWMDGRVLYVYVITKLECGMRRGLVGGAMGQGKCRRCSQCW